MHDRPTAALIRQADQGLLGRSSGVAWPLWYWNERMFLYHVEREQYRSDILTGILTGISVPQFDPQLHEDVGVQCNKLRMVDNIPWQLLRVLLVGINCM